MNFEDYLNQRKSEIERTLHRCLPKKETSVVAEAMRYTVFSGGKRIRPILTMSTAELFGQKREDAIMTACGIELIHNFTLVHDDLPCMDDDDFRRGKLTIHRIYGEGIATLAGDALLNYGFKLIIDDTILHKMLPQVCVRILSEICEAMGIRGVIGGQAEDLLLKDKGKNKIKLSTLDNIYTRKTGALICAAIRMGAILGQASERELSLLTNYGKNLGTAFQIMNDISEVEQSKRRKRKTTTYLSLIKPYQAELIAKRKIRQAKKYLNVFGPMSKILCSIADYTIQAKA
jgi:geranylgeranyl diphosphate synthase type II